MKIDKKHIHILIIIACIFAILSGTFVLTMVQKFLLQMKDVRQRRIHLLCETDYQALLDACIELSKKVDKGELTAGKWYIIRRNPDAEMYGFPKVILDLAPSYIIIKSDGNVIMEMLGGFNHFGISVSPNVSEKPVFGDRELIPGLWYYDDNYNEDPKYDQKIDRLISKYMGILGVAD